MNLHHQRKQNLKDLVFLLKPRHPRNYVHMNKQKAYNPQNFAPTNLNESTVSLTLK